MKMLNVSEVLTILEKGGLTSSRQGVLRWIRQGDLPAVQETRKVGYQAAIRDLLEKLSSQEVSYLAQGCSPMSTFLMGADALLRFNSTHQKIPGE